MEIGMNDQIKDLTKKYFCGTKVTLDEGSYNFYEFSEQELNHFTKDVVKETLDELTSRVWKNVSFYAREDMEIFNLAVTELKKHFGVE